MSKALLLSLSLVVSCVSFSALAETKFSLSGDAFVRGYFTNSTGPDGTQAFNHFLRLKMEAKPDESLTLRAGVVLASETLEGDTHTALTSTAVGTPVTGTAIGGTNEDSSGKGNITHLDHAVIEYNAKNGWITSVGRHVVSSPGNFLTSDDRRDRLQVLKFESNGVWAFLYDKRAEGALNNSRDDLDMYSVNYYGKAENLSYALQTAYWSSETNKTLKHVKQVTPQLGGHFFGMDFNLYYTFLAGGDKASFYPDTHHSMAFQLSKDLETVKIYYQAIYTINGGLIASGFDTYSSVINNSPDHSNSLIKLRTIGFGFGRKDADEHLHIIKIAAPLYSKFTASVSGGFGKIYVYALSKLEKDKIVDATLKYTFSNNLNLALLYGKFFGDYKDHAGSLSLNATF